MYAASITFSSILLPLLTSSNIKDTIEIGSGQELNVECTTSPLFSGKLVWKKEEGGHLTDITEINFQDSTFNFTTFNYSSDFDYQLLRNEQLGQLFVYRYSNTRVVLGTRKAEVFGAAIGIAMGATGTYQCYAENYTNSIRYLQLAGTFFCS